MHSVVLIFFSAVLSSPSGLSSIKNMLSSPQQEVRIQAIDKIVEGCTLNPECTEKNLLPTVALEDPDLSVRVKAIEGMRKLGMKEEFRKICSILKEFAWSEALKDTCVQPVEWKRKEPQRKGAFSYPQPDPTRIGYTPSAFLRKKGTFAWNTYELGYWVFDYTIDDHFSFIMHTSIPALVFGVGPGLKASFKLRDDFRAGALAHFVFGTVYAISSNFLIAVGGLPFILTYGNPDGFFSMSLLTYGFFISDGSDIYKPWVIDPNIGGFYRLTDTVAFQAEFHIPTFGEGKDTAGPYGGILYGLRVSGKRVYGDINFIVPIFSGMGDLLQFLPLGFPFVSFGIAW